MMHFNKPAITPGQQLELLQRRGLLVNDPERALAFLKAVTTFMSKYQT